MNVFDLLQHHTKATGESFSPTKDGRRKGRPLTVSLAMTGEQLDVMAGLKVKPKAIYKTAVRRGIDIHGSLLKGENPFDVIKPQYMRVACRMLLEDSFTIASLKIELGRAFPSWSSGNVSTHASIAKSLLLGLGVVTLNPATKSYTLNRL